MNVPAINRQVALAAKANRQQAQPPEFEDAYGATWFVIEESNKVIGRLNKPVFDLDREENEAVFLMFFNSLSDIMSAVYTLSSGWVRPSITALRGALETIATATAIHHDADKMERFVKGKLNVTTQITGIAKQILPGIERLYGALTNQWTHETYDTTARSISRSSRQLLLIPEVEPENMSIYLNVFVEAAVLAQMVGIGLEACFPCLAGEEVHFTTGEDGKRYRLPAPSGEAIEIAVQARNAFQR